MNYEILKQNKLPFSNMHIFAITDMFHLSTDLFNILNAFVSNQTNLNALNAGNLILISYNTGVTLWKGAQTFLQCVPPLGIPRSAPKYIRLHNEDNSLNL